MYVVETAAGSIETMKITVISFTSAQWVVDVLPEFTIDKLKQMALSHFYNPIDSIKVAERYKLILVSDGRPLPDEGTVRDENICENDELLLLKRRLMPQIVTETSKEKEEKARGPTEAEIQKYTSGLSQKNMDSLAEDCPVVVDFHTELRKILVSLVKASEKLLRYHPDIVDLFKEIAEDKEVSEFKDTVDHNALKQLMDMGFPEDKAIQALRVNSNSEEATEWLLSQGTDNETSSSPSASDSFSATSLLTSRRDQLKTESLVNSTSQNSPSTASTSELPSDGENPNPSPIVRMLQCFRSYKRKVFRPNMTAFSNLKEMGFAEPDILDALRINGNNQDTACEWLLSDKKLNFDDIDKGLDPDGSIYKSIMANSVVQLGLSNPNTFLALLHMLENPNSACRWLSDPETAPILSQIFRIYHAEKHSLQLARPFPQL